MPTFGTSLNLSFKTVEKLFSMAKRIRYVFSIVPFHLRDIPLASNLSCQYSMCVMVVSSSLFSEVFIQLPPGYLSSSAVFFQQRSSPVSIRVKIALGRVHISGLLKIFGGEGKVL